MKAILVICLIALACASSKDPLPADISKLPAPGADVQALRDLNTQAQLEKINQTNARVANNNELRLLTQQLLDNQRRNDVVTYETSKNAALLPNENQYNVTNPAFVAKAKAAAVAGTLNILGDEIALEKAGLGLKKDELLNNNKTVNARLDALSALQARAVAALEALTNLPADLTKLPAAGATPGQLKDLQNATAIAIAANNAKQDQLKADQAHIAQQIAVIAQKNNAINFEANKNAAGAADDKALQTSDPKFILSLQQAIAAQTVNILVDELTIDRLTLSLKSDELGALLAPVKARNDALVALSKRIADALKPKKPTPA
jgi:hypothetical protein